MDRAVQIHPPGWMEGLCLWFSLTQSQMVIINSIRNKTYICDMSHINISFPFSSSSTLSFSHIVSRGFRYSVVV